jgi:POT family proton-dependent oligopeptide transporter
MVSRLAPPKIVGMVIGAWYLSSSLACQVGGWIANLTTDESSYEIADNSENTETIDESTASYTAILAGENSQQALQTAVNKNYLSEETLQTISDEEKVSVVNLLRYTNVFVNVGLAALVASILLFLLSPMIHRMMHEG